MARKAHFWCNDVVSLSLAEFGDASSFFFFFGVPSFFRSLGTSL